MKNLCIIVCGGRIHPNENNKTDSEMRITKTIKIIANWKKSNRTLPYVILSGDYTCFGVPKGIREWKILRDEFKKQNKKLFDELNSNGHIEYEKESRETGGNIGNSHTKIKYLKWRYDKLYFIGPKDFQKLISLNLYKYFRLKCPERIVVDSRENKVKFNYKKMISLLILLFNKKLQKYAVKKCCKKPS